MVDGLCQCGCGLSAPIAKRNWKARGWIKGQPMRFIRGHSPRPAYTVKHGMSKTPEYQAYRDAKQRCTRGPEFGPSWKNYGGRGIKFLFISFEQWFAELGPRPSPKHSIDRIITDGHYEPGNVRWATKAEQSQNQRPYDRFKPLREYKQRQAS